MDTNKYAIKDCDMMNYCKSRNFHKVFIFANFASEQKMAKLKTRENNLFAIGLRSMNVKIAKLN